MGIGSIVMPDYDILSILDSHLFHILLCYLHHKLIGQAWLVLRFEADGYVADRLADPWVQLGLDVEALGGDLRVVGDDAVVGDYFCLVFAVGVCCAASRFPALNSTRSSVITSTISSFITTADFGSFR